MAVVPTDQRLKSLEKRISDVRKRRNEKVQRGAKVSIEGRGLGGQ